MCCEATGSSAPSSCCKVDHSLTWLHHRSFSVSACSSAQRQKKLPHFRIHHKIKKRNSPVVHSCVLNASQPGWASSQSVSQSSGHTGPHCASARLCFLCVATAWPLEGAWLQPVACHSQLMLLFDLIWEMVSCELCLSYWEKLMCDTDV